MDLIIRDDFKRLIPKLSDDEYAQLEANILNEGVLSPLIVWNNIILDGHNRYEIATKYGLYFETTEKDFDSDSDAKEWMILHQFGRRNLSHYQRSVLALELEGLFKDRIEKDRIEKISHYRKTGEVLETVANLRQSQINDSPRVVNELSKIANVSPRLITQVKVIEQKAAPEVKEKLSSGEVSIHQAYQEIRKEEKKQEIRNKIIESRVNFEDVEYIKNGNSIEIIKQMPDGCIDIVLTDPPYGISYKSNRSIYDDAITKRGLLNDDAEDAFKLLDEICRILYDKTAANAHLYFFCSWSVFSEFEDIIGRYFTIKTPIVWNKGNKGSGDLENDWGNQTEIVIFCVKGKKLINERKGNVIEVSRLHTSKMVHPTQKPVELINQILSVSYNDGDFVVDPFMGSGSTIKACRQINANCLGVELDADMFQIAKSFIHDGL